ncbi:DNA glycosylase [Acephala macrosclerotiorum]|nr:DNA glycosylase [Acephala macrosclerotiorum]
MPTRAATKRAAAAAKKAAQSLSSPPVTPVHDVASPDIGINAIAVTQHVKTTQARTLSPSEPATAKRKRVTKSKKAPQSMKVDWDVLPHGLGKKGDLEHGFDADEALKDVKPKLGRKRKAFNVRISDGNFKEENVQDLAPAKKRARKQTPVEKAPKKKKHPYGLTPGVSPFPDLAKPTLEDCEEVNRLLSKLHGEVKAPDVIPPPSMEITGCGEVPDLLDALLRTLLSASTTSKNSNMALQGLKDTFGLRTSGVGKGSINWEAVRETDLDKVIDAIKSGGLAKSKGNNIKKILDAVYQNNLNRFNALKQEKETGEPAQVLGAKHETQEQKDRELAEFEGAMLSMDYLFELTTDEVMEELLKLPGIGVKTSSCVILFCMKRPSFAVDTHVWRHCKWLGWVPENANRDKTFSHLEVRIPDELKYALHQLFIQHGKKCPRCKANTGPSSESWEDCECPIEHLVKRTGKTKEKSGKKGAKGGYEVEDEDNEETEAAEDFEDE